MINRVPYDANQILWMPHGVSFDAPQLFTGVRVAPARPRDKLCDLASLRKTKPNNEANYTTYTGNNLVSEDRIRAAVNYGVS